jgi:ferredoxin--NADP+ reductase
MVLAHNELYAAEDGSVRPRATDRRSTIPVDLVFRAIGYKGEPIAGLPFDERGGIIPNRAGKIIDPATDAPVLGEYVCGWIKRGPQGVIGTNKPCAQEAVNGLLEDVREGRIDRAVPAREVLERVLAERQRDLVTYADWQVLDGLERARGEVDGRPRVKFTRIEDMLAALGEGRDAAV